MQQVRKHCILALRSVHGANCPHNYSSSDRCACKRHIICCNPLMLYLFTDAQTDAPPVDSFQCDFENGDVCEFQQSTTDDWDWTVLQGSTPTDNTGPPVDHTTGTSVGKVNYFRKHVVQFE